ncbi:hypothetical protein MG295_00011 [Bacillus phage vB_BcgM]|nr:hypothetical protein MG295_00011 [Bacillus phage vB_BcgM]
MTRHTRNKQLIKLEIMQGEDVRFAKWNYSSGYNLTIEESVRRQGIIDPTFRWVRYNLSGKVKNRIHFSSTIELQLGEKKSTIPCVRYIDVNKGRMFC